MLSSAGVIGFVGLCLEFYSSCWGRDSCPQGQQALYPLSHLVRTKMYIFILFTIHIILAFTKKTKEDLHTNKKEAVLIYFYTEE